MNICNGSAIWNINQTWYSSWPQFTDCFQSTVLVWVPCGWLWVTSPFYIYYIFKVTKTALSSRGLYTAKMISCFMLVLISSVRIISTVSDRSFASIEVAVAAPTIQAVTFIFALFVMYMERRKGFVTSGVLFVFWILHLVAGIVPLYSQVIEKDYVNHLSIFGLHCWYYAVVFLQFVLSCFAETPSPCSTGDVYFNMTALIYALKYLGYMRVFKYLFITSTQDASSELSASFLSRITFWWVNRLLLRGYKTTLEETDVFDLSPRDKSDNNIRQFLSCWNSHRKMKRTKQKYKDMNVSYSNIHTQRDNNEKSPLLPSKSKVKLWTISGTEVSLTATLLRVYWFDLLQSQIWKVFSELLRFASPLILGQLIAFTTDKTMPQWKGYSLCAVLFCSILVQTFCAHANWHQSVINSIRVGGVLISAIFRKALTMSSKSRRERTSGEIVNLMSIDVQHVRQIANWMWTIWSGPMKISLALYLLYQLLGNAMFAGMAVIVVLVPINTVAMSKMRTYESELMSQKDRRMKLMNEILNGIKILKLYAWEPSFQERVEEVRKQELSILWRLSMMKSCMSFTWTLSPYVISLCTFMTYIYTSEDHYLRPQVAFTALSLLNIVRMSVSTFPTLFSTVVQASVSMNRISKYLNSSDLDETQISFKPKQDFAISITNGKFRWNSEIGLVLNNINMSVKVGQLTAVVGPVGSGKSSLISAMLGEIEKVEGLVSLKSSVAYVSQQAWIQNDTLQNNILFGKPMDRQLYNQVIDCCALTADLEVLPGGDLTEIGERGINLSGGQKQRVSLARAVYSDADIYLFDDPLSAVDSHVGKHIYDKLIGKRGLIAKKTRVLVTHGIHWLPEMDSIIVINNGQISEIGTYEELQRNNGPFAEMLKNYMLETRVGDNKSHIISDTNTVLSCEDEHLHDTFQINSSVQKQPSETRPQKEKKLIEEEFVAKGKVNLGVVLAYGRALGLLFVVFAFLMYILYQVTSVVGNTWISKWTDDKGLSNETLLPSNSSGRLEKNSYYLGIYGAFGIAQTICIMIFSFVWNSRTVKASGILHSRMLRAILRSPMSFFDTTPTGRIINRFSLDIDTIDTMLSQLVQSSINTSLQVLSTIVIICYTTPIFIVVVVPVIIIYIFIQRFYVTTSRQLKRLESKTRSPIYSHFGETISGAGVIRSYQAQRRFIQESERRVDTNQRFLFYAFCALRWQGVRLEILGNFIILAATLFAVSSRDTLSGGLVGLSISYALELTATLNYMVQLISDLETQIVSVERVKHYTDIQTESEWNIPQRRSNHDWPDSGSIQFADYSTRYRDGLDLVLRGISFNIHPMEKVGIVGRTGAGKSSLTLSLFRLIEAAGGEINIGGVDISSLGLHDLRNKLTVLPQDPVLFAGSLRSNVDPFNQYSDSEIWRALEHAHLKDFVEALPETLEHDCSEGGDNISVGQRQLLCLARALLKKTKILVLDEATAAVDMETDDLIQQTIRSEFKDCTVLTIAHRLNTVMDYDRILVLDNGCVAEFDSPTNLLQRPNSVFYDMARTAGLTS